MERKGLLTYLMLFITAFCLFNFTQPQGKTRISDDSITSAGITVVQKASLREEPNTNSEIIKKLEFGVPFFILKKQPFFEGQRRFHWYKIMLTDRETMGWVISKEGREGHFEVIDLEKDNFASLYYSVACHSLWSYRDYDAAERLFHYVLEKYSDKEILVKEYTGATFELFCINREIAVLENLAKLYQDKQQYEKSIEYYEQVAKHKEASRKTVVKAKRNIMLIYKENIKDKEKTIALCHNIIREYPNEEISGFEWNLWVDIEAADIIVKAYSLEAKNIDKLVRESKKIISETLNPPVILIATRGMVISQINSGKYELAKATLLDVIKKYPKEVRYYFKTPRNFTIDPLASALEAIVSEYGNYVKAIEFTKVLRDSVQQKEITDFTNYKIAQLLDEGGGNKEQVLTSYEKVSDLWVWDPISRREISPWDIKRRIEQIKIYEVEKAVVSEENVIMKPGLRSKPQSYKSIPKGTQVEIIYKDRKIVQINEKEGHWAKVRLTDGRIGWIFDGFLSPILKRRLFSPLADREKIWFMEGANSNHTSAINAKIIKEPALVKVFPNIINKEIVFSDINNDRILDILTYSSKGLVAIDGTTQKIIWIFNCSNGSIPVIRNDIVYLIAFTKDGEYLYALDKRTAKPIWRVLVSKHGHGLSPSSPAVNDNFIYVGTTDGTVLTIDIREGKIVWKFSSSHPIVGAITKVKDLVYFASRENFQGNDKLFALDAFTGKLMWKFDFHSKNTYGYVPAICVEDGTLFCSGANECLYALDADRGQLLWQIRLTKKNSHYAWFKPSVFAGTVYFATPEKEICAVDSKTGDVKWKYIYSHSLWGTPAILKDGLYIRSIDSYLHAISLSDGQLLWKFKIGSGAYGGAYSPSVAQGLVFIGSTDKNLYVIGEKSDMNKKNSNNSENSR